MSSPAESVRTRSGRVSTRRVPERRRQRPRNDSESLRPRKRSKIADEGGNGDEGLNGVVAGNGNMNGERRVSHRGLTLREKGRTGSGAYRLGGGGGKLDGGSTLSRTPEYSIKHLQGLPDTIKKDSSNYRAFFHSLSATVHKVIITTNTQILIWDFNSSTQTPVPTIISAPIKLNKGERLPLAAVVPHATSSEVGLFLAYPSLGKIWYWENIDVATSATMVARGRDGIEGSIRLMSGEYVEKLVAVEHGGFILVCSSGRLAYAALRDQNQRPAVVVSFLNNDSQSSGGWFGSLKATLGGGWRNSVADVKTRAFNNRFETVALTQEGAFKVWDMDHSGSSQLRSQFSVSEMLRETFIDYGLVGDTAKTSINILDFAILPRTSSHPRHSDAASSAMEAMVLVSYEDVGETDRTLFVLADLSITDSGREITRLIPINVFMPKAGTVMPASAFELSIPAPGHSAFIAMPNAVIVASLEKVYRDPRVAFRSETFQDIVYFKYEDGAEVVTSAPEFHAPSKSEASSLLVFLKDFGALRFVAERPSRDPSRQQLSAKTKMEQGVFFRDGNRMIDFSMSGSFRFSQQDIEVAAVALSHEILNSSSPHVPEGSSEMSQQIQLRMSNLKQLANFVLSVYENDNKKISAATKWLLLWDAEKLEAANALWMVYDRWLSEKHVDDKILFPSYIRAVHEGNGDARNGANYVQGDPVRHFIVHEADHVDRVLESMEAVLLNEHSQRGKDDWDALAQYLLEAQEISIKMFKAAYEFRSRHLERYHLSDARVNDGVIVSGYEGLPEPWTAKRNNCTRIGSFAKQLQAFTLVLMDGSRAPEPLDVDADIVEQLRLEMWELIYINSIQHEERYQWLSSRADEEARANGERVKHEFEKKVRPEQLQGLADLGRAIDGMKVAEKTGDLGGLVQLCVAEIEQIGEQDGKTGLMRSTRRPEQVTPRKQAMFDRLNVYFEKYGEEFATGFFGAEIASGRLADLLKEDFGRQKELTQFLRSDNATSKISWINEVTRQKDFLRAGETLMNVAQTRETNIWSKAAEISLAKLSLAGAARQREQRVGQLVNFDDKLDQKLGNEARIAKIQVQLYKHVAPSFETGIDADGAVDLAMGDFANSAVKHRNANKMMLQQGFAALHALQAMDAELVIDTLTLMDSIDSEQNSIHGKEFLLALKVLDATGECEGHDSSQGEMLRALIWKRLLLRDDWPKLSVTKGKRDKDVASNLKSTLLYRTLEEGAKTGPGPSGLWNSTPAFAIPDPSTIIEAGSTPADLASRFPNPAIGEHIAKDNTKDGELLATYMEKHRLPLYLENAVKAAEEAGRAFREKREEVQRAKEGAGVKLVEREGWWLSGRRGVVLRGESEGPGEEEEEDEDEGEEDVLTQEQVDVINGVAAEEGGEDEGGEDDDVIMLED